MALSPRQRWTAAIAVLLFLCLGTVVVLRSGKARPEPKLVLKYLGKSGGAGEIVARFAVTNVGSASAIAGASGWIEVFGRTNEVSVGGGATAARLAPGAGDVVQAFLPPGFKGRWRYTCRYGHEGLRSRISNWQWGPGGPGASANWMVPSFLKGLPLDVVATSGWLDE